MFTIKTDFVDKTGRKFEDVRDIHYDKKEDIKNNLGKFITETKHEKDGMFFTSGDDLNDGVYIYKSNYNPLKALRIYKNWADYKYCSHSSDVKLVYELLRRQPFIKYTDFPTGIVSLENYVIGQEIPFYEGYKDLIDIVKLKDIRKVMKYYSDMIKILEELCMVDIIYTDCHTKNFLVNENTDEVKLIDFDPAAISLKNELYSYKRMIETLKVNINRINELKKIPFVLEKEEKLEDIKETMLSKKII